MLNDLNVDINFSFDKIVLQPTSLCNLDCTYCYLPHKHTEQKMLIEVAERVADNLSHINNPLTIIWHGGEPLSCGVQYLDQLMKPFNFLRKKQLINFAIQTNATLLTQEWCDFLKDNCFQVGLSIDGPSELNQQRVDRGGKLMYDKIMKGINLLKENEIKFHVIAVIHEKSLHKASELYTFFSNLGCWSLGINIEEQEGANCISSVTKKHNVQNFWHELFKVWRLNPKIRIREFDFALNWMQSVNLNLNQKNTKRNLDIFPTIGWNGDVILLSPELHGAVSKKYGNFIAGNVLRENLFTITNRAHKVEYVDDFIKGVKKCSEICSYYSFCGGGFASNKFYELGTTNGTETTNCTNSKQRLINALVEAL